MLIEIFFYIKKIDWGFFEFIGLEVFWDIFGICLREEIVKMLFIFVFDVIGFMGDDIENVIIVIKKIVNEVKDS